MRELLDHELPRWSPPQLRDTPRLVALSPMLVNVLDSLCEGKGNRAIAADWGISEDTVKTHIKRLLAKIGARDRTHIVALVLGCVVDVRIKPGRETADWSRPWPIAVP